MARRIVLEFDRRGLHAVEAIPRRGGPVVHASITATRPVAIDPEDPAEYGAWIGETLTAGGLKASRVLVALSRDAVVAKRLRLPTTVEEELPGMVQLALAREMPFDPETAAIDFVVVPSTEEAPTSTEVLAVAAPDTALDAVRATVKAAGRRLAGVTLRSLGAARLAAFAGVGHPDRSGDEHPVSSDDDATAERHGPAGVTGGDPQLLVDVGDRSVEIVLLSGGMPRLVRGAEIPTGLDDEQRSRVVTVETRRTWLAAAVSLDAELGGAIVLGPAGVAERLETELPSILHVPVSRVRPGDAVSPADDEARAGLDAGGWPLAALLRPLPSGRGLDLLRPRRVAAPRQTLVRRVGLVAVLVIVLGGIAFTMARQELETLRAELDELQGELAPLQNPIAELRRERVRRTHLNRWSQVDPGWLEHLAAIESRLPPPGDVVLDRISASLDFRGVRYDRRSKAWSSPFELGFAIEGECRDRVAAEAVRAAFVVDSAYSISSSGSDGRPGRRLPVRFTYGLRTGDVQPPVDDVEEGIEPDVEGASEADADADADAAAAEPAGARGTVIDEEDAR